VFYGLEQAVKGMAEACRALGVPVISGNVSLYNETSGAAIYPTPVVGMLGLLEDAEKRRTMAFRAEGHVIALLGSADEPGLGGSEYLDVVCARVAGKLSPLDLDLERRLQECYLAAVERGIIGSGHDCSDGGMAVALAECCIAGDIGAIIAQPQAALRPDAWLFGEAPSRIVVSLESEDVGAMSSLAGDWNVPMQVLGRTGGRELVIGDLIQVPLKVLERTWKEALAEKLQ